MFLQRILRANRWLDRRVTWTAYARNTSWYFIRRALASFLKSHILRTNYTFQFLLTALEIVFIYIFHKLSQGALYGCPQFPGQDETYNAPSICADQMKSFGVALSTDSLPDSMEIMLKAGRSQLQLCSEDCYGSYLFYTTEFFKECDAEILATDDTQYQKMHGLEPTQQFRGQVCTKADSLYNENVEHNCFDENRALIEASQSGDSDFNILALLADTQCELLSLGGQAGLDKLCNSFSAFQCCAANEFTLLLQQSATILLQQAEFLPPCMANYLTHECPAVSFDNFCSQGTVLDITTQRVHIRITGLHTEAQIPNLYNAGNVTMVMEVVAQGSVPSTVSYHPPIAGSALTTTILSYSYLDTDGNSLTPIAPSGNTSDYDNAHGLDLTVQITLGGVGNISAEIALNAEANLAAVIKGALKCPLCTVEVTADPGDATYTEVDPTWNVKGSPKYEEQKKKNKKKDTDEGALTKAGFTALMGSLLGLAVVVPGLGKWYRKWRLWHRDDEAFGR